AAALGEGALDPGPLVRRALPLGLGREPRARPARVGVGLVVAHVAHGLVGPQRRHAREGEAPPLAVALLPVEGRAPAARERGGETVGEPELRARVAAVAHELEVLGVGHGPRGELEGLDEDAVARALVVEGEAAAGAADLAQTGVEAEPALRRG